LQLEAVAEAERVAAKDAVQKQKKLHKEEQRAQRRKKAQGVLSLFHLDGGDECKLNAPSQSLSLFCCCATTGFEKMVHKGSSKLAKHMKQKAASTKHKKGDSVTTAPSLEYGNLILDLTSTKCWLY